MSDNHDYLKTADNQTFRLRADVLALMLKGAGYAAIFCLVVGFFIAITIWVGGFLPPESKEAPDPTPFSSVVTHQSSRLG
ncbi:RC-LH1 core complex protein PufX [Sulfitobacter sp. S190]|uniref:RC-LH1 core complex protein PufX n=1 Tax=Sulfitobacter sp. S190 TaxID=2867022 RepID=UPI0021A85484|nr:RC-LH1 core complex protein PufX [Sulfitobacter sp. S190]UWR24355.1 RC-LH1 core complex protein PufX [Sulfitobacter sp. S190]